MKIDKPDPRIGAIATDVDVRSLSDSDWNALYRAWLDGIVLVVRGQTLTIPEFLDYSRRFGRVKPHRVRRTRHPDYPELLLVTNIPEEDGKPSASKYTGHLWHSDMSFTPVPSLGSLLRGIAIPPVGGDTMFTNMYRAYDTLSDGMKRMLGDLKGVNESAKAVTTRTREDRMKTDGKQDVDELIAEHPVVRTHPETGRKALYVNVAHTTRFAGMTVEESAPILNWLHAHQSRPEFTCRFQWQVGSLAFWDNRATHHNPINDYHGHRRVMHRITLKGDKPR